MKKYNGWHVSHRICDRVISIVEQTQLFPSYLASQAWSAAISRRLCPETDWRDCQNRLTETQGKRAALYKW